MNVRRSVVRRIKIHIQKAEAQPGYREAGPYIGRLDSVRLVEAECCCREPHACCCFLIRAGGTMAKAAHIKPHQAREATKCMTFVRLTIVFSCTCVIIYKTEKYTLSFGSPCVSILTDLSLFPMLLASFENKTSIPISDVHMNKPLAYNIWKRRSSGGSQTKTNAISKITAVKSEPPGVHVCFVSSNARTVRAIARANSAIAITSVTKIDS